MRSLTGLIAVVAAATFYLYLLSAFLPPCPQLVHHRRDDTVESKDTASAESEVVVEQYRYVIQTSDFAHPACSG